MNSLLLEALDGISQNKRLLIFAVFRLFAILLGILVATLTI